MGIIDHIMQRPELVEQPPVLLDIGAAARLNPKWKSFSRYSVCIAFDADARQMGYIESRRGRYRKLYVYRAVVSDQAGPKKDFFLTASPQCSSLLEPDRESLSAWLCADMLKVDRVVSLDSTRLETVLNELGLQWVDWFKTDSQGTDLRLFNSLNLRRRQRTLATEFEPGIMACYIGEDKLHQVMAAMDDADFMMSQLAVHGPQRISPLLADRYFRPPWRLILGGLLRSAPGWAGVTYLNRLTRDGLFGPREHLLGWVFATVERQHGLALEIVQRGRDRFGDDIFDRLARHSVRRIKANWWRAAPFVARQILRSIIQRRRITRAR